VNKAPGAEVNPPTPASVTFNSITIEPVTPPATGQAVQYAIEETDDADVSTLIWQDDDEEIVFFGLSPKTMYYVYARSAEQANYYAGMPVVSEAITTPDIPTTPIYDIMLTESGTCVFPSATCGYGALTPRPVVIINTGNQPTGELTVLLAGTNANSFTLSKTSVASIAVNSAENFTLVPKPNLVPKTYTAMVMVFGGYNISKTFNVSFTVKDTIPINTGIHDDDNVETRRATSLPNMYPNPVFNGRLMIELPDNIEKETVQIYDFSGKLMLTRTVTRPKTELNISHLPDGTYIVAIGAQSKKIIKATR